MSAPRPPISTVDTGTTALIGHIPDSADPPGTIYRVGSWTEFLHIARPSPNSGRAWNDLIHAVNGFFLNGGRRCVVAEGGMGDERGSAAALDALAVVEDVSIVAAPGLITPTAYAALTAHCEALRDRVAIFDGPGELTDAHLKVMAGAAGEAPDGWRMPPPSPEGYTTLYAPRIMVADPEAQAGGTVRVPASGHIAGAWVANDVQRGVWKAPTAVSVAGAVDVARRLNEAEQSLINPRGINALRVFPDRGVLLWGARTLSPNAEWRYIPVRRLLTMITASIGRATGWVMNEPNNEPLWIDLRRVIEEFLFGLWRTGALVGDKPEHAYFARCDRSTMTQDDLDNGRVIALIGVAPVRPAEFVIVRIAWSVAGFVAG